jgi:hypothetical protein
MALAALIAFLAGASTPLALALAPPFIVRIAAPRRVREHAVTAGFAAGPRHGGGGRPHPGGSVTAASADQSWVIPCANLRR